MGRLSFFFIMIAFNLFAPCVFAKDLTHRIGVGYKSPFPIDVPGIAVQYYPYQDIGFSGVLGIDTQKNNSKFGLMARGYRILYQEENMNFYMGGGAGLLTDEAAGVSESGVGVAAFVGGEFFLQGLENLGFSFEGGFDVASLKSGVRFRTFGASPLTAGMIFYF